MKIPNFSDVLDIDIKNGKCYWKKLPKCRMGLLGKEAGCITNSGKDYWIIRVNKKGYKRSHIIFWKKYGRMPSEVIDHINGNSLDDRIENLREVSCQVNAQNRKVGYKGKKLPIGVRVSYTNKNGVSRYSARIRHNGKTYHLGGYDNPQDAYEKYIIKRKEFLCES